jgi:multidrug transporter EmrE-like cation transporter
MILIIIVITALANLADVLLKKGALEAGSSLSDPAAIFLTPWIWLGGLLGVTAMGLWVYILGRHHISHAYPIFVGLGFVNVTLASKFYFEESISPLRIAGIGLIMAGIVVVHFMSSGKAAGGPGARAGTASGNGTTKAMAESEAAESSPTGSGTE